MFTYLLPPLSDPISLLSEKEWTKSYNVQCFRVFSSSTITTYQSSIRNNLLGSNPNEQYHAIFPTTAFCSGAEDCFKSLMRKQAKPDYENRGNFFSKHCPLTVDRDTPMYTIHAKILIFTGDRSTCQRLTMSRI